VGAVADDKSTEGAGAPVVDSETSYEAAMAAYRDGRYSEAQRRFAEIANQPGEHAPSAALYEVQALRMVSGCPTAAPRFEALRTRYPGSVGNDAAWQAADCHRALGNLSRARALYEQLATDASYKARAKEALAELDQRASNELAAKKPAVSAPAKGKAAATSAAPPPAAAKPASPARE
jgi:TolA-binding protein